MLYISTAIKSQTIVRSIWLTAKCAVTSLCTVDWSAKGECRPLRGLGIGWPAADTGGLAELRVRCVIRNSEKSDSQVSSLIAAAFSFLYTVYFLY